jgi:O-antigen ligase
MDALQKTFGIGFGIDGYINPTGKIAHNTFLQVLIGCGLVGILLFIVFVMGIFIMYKKFIIKQTSLNYRLFCTFGIMSWFVLILLLLRGGGAQIFPYFMSSIQIGATIGLIINSRDGEIAASSKYR